MGEQSYSEKRAASQHLNFGLLGALRAHFLPKPGLSVAHGVLNGVPHQAGEHHFFTDMAFEGIMAARGVKVKALLYRIRIRIH